MNAVNIIIEEGQGPTEAIQKLILSSPDHLDHHMFQARPGGFPEPEAIGKREKRKSPALAVGRQLRHPRGFPFGFQIHLLVGLVGLEGGHEHTIRMYSGVSPREILYLFETKSSHLILQVGLGNQRKGGKKIRRTPRIAPAILDGSFLNGRKSPSENGTEGVFP